MFDLRDVMRFTALIVQPNESDRSCTIDLQLVPEPLVVHGNPIAIQIALASLVWGAIELGGRQVGLRITPHTDTLDICIESDARKDIPPDTWHAQVSASEMQWGNGDGPAQQDLVLAIIREHGGELTDVRRPDHSVSACITLPRYR